MNSVHPQLGVGWKGPHNSLVNGSQSKRHPAFMGLKGTMQHLVPLLRVTECDYKLAHQQIRVEQTARMKPAHASTRRLIHAPQHQLGRMKGNWKLGH